MKRLSIIFFIGLFLSNCGENIAKTELDKTELSKQKDSHSINQINKVKVDTSSALKIEKNQKTDTDSIIQLNYELFQNLELTLTEIDKNKFNDALSSYIQNNRKSCSFKSLNLTQKSDCDEICIDYLSENNSNKIVYLPCSYDAGIIGASFSPNCKKLIVCSSYDGTDFDNYYENRAEIYLFKIIDSTGINSIKPVFKFSTKDWSIDNYCWISENKIALKIYTEDRRGDESNQKYKYYQTNIPDKKK